MSEKSVIDCLDNLLVKIEVYTNKKNPKEKDKEKLEEIKEEFLEVVNHYAKAYPLLIPRYKEKGNKIIYK